MKPKLNTISDHHLTELRITRDSEPLNENQMEQGTKPLNGTQTEQGTRPLNGTRAEPSSGPLNGTERKSKKHNNGSKKQDMNQSIQFIMAQRNKK
ncbi:hypothetical protein ACFX14_004382 [Malus domestica]